MDDFFRSFNTLLRKLCVAKNSNNALAFDSLPEEALNLVIELCDSYGFDGEQTNRLINLIELQFVLEKRIRDITEDFTLRHIAIAVEALKGVA